MQSAKTIESTVERLYRHLSLDARQTIIADVTKRSSSEEFVRDPSGYLAAWDERRGQTEEFRIPEDASRNVMATLADSAKRVSI